MVARPTQPSSPAHLPNLRACWTSPATREPRLMRRRRRRLVYLERAILSLNFGSFVERQYRSNYLGLNQAYDNKKTER